MHEVSASPIFAIAKSICSFSLAAWKNGETGEWHGLSFSWVPNTMASHSCANKIKSLVDASLGNSNDSIGNDDVDGDDDGISFV